MGCQGSWDVASFGDREAAYWAATVLGRCYLLVIETLVVPYWRRLLQPLLDSAASGAACWPERVRHGVRSAARRGSGSSVDEAFRPGFAAAVVAAVVLAPSVAVALG